MCFFFFRRCCREIKTGRKSRLQQRELHFRIAVIEALKQFDRVCVRSLWECGFLLVCQLAGGESGRLTFPRYLLVVIDRLQMNCNCVNLQGAESSRLREHGESGLPRERCTSRLQRRPQSMLSQRGRTSGKRGRIQRSEGMNDPQERRRRRDGMMDGNGGAGSRQVQRGARKPPSSQTSTPCC